MLLDVTRDDGFEKSLRRFASRTGKYEGRRDVLSSVLESASDLAELNRFLKSDFGRYLEPDDFFKLIKDSEDGDDYTAFSVGINGDEVRNMVAMLIKMGKTPSVGLVAGEPPHGSSFISVCAANGKLKDFFVPELWILNPQALEELPQKIRENGYIGEESRNAAEAAITKCLQKIRTMPAIEGDYTHELVLKCEDGFTFFSNPRNWDRFSEVQRELTKKGEPLTWGDLVGTELPNGNSLIGEAAKLGKLSEVVQNLPNATYPLSPAFLDKTVSDDKTIHSILAETGQLLPVYLAVGMTRKEILKAAKTLTEREKKDNGIDALILRDKILASRVDSSSLGLMKRLARKFGL